MLKPRAFKDKFDYRHKRLSNEAVDSGQPPARPAENTAAKVGFMIQRFEWQDYLR